MTEQLPTTTRFEDFTSDPMAVHGAFQYLSILASDATGIELKEGDILFYHSLNSRRKSLIVTQLIMSGHVNDIKGQLTITEKGLDLLAMQTGVKHLRRFVKFAKPQTFNEEWEMW